MLKEFILFPATLSLENETLSIVSELQELHVNSAWLLQWQQRVEAMWPVMRTHLQSKGLMQLMLEGETALLLLPLVQ